MSCPACWGVHTSASAAIRCYEASKVRDQYLPSGPPENAVQPRKETKNLRSGFLGHRSRGGRPRKHGTSPAEQSAFDRERKRRWREKKTRPREASGRLTSEAGER